MDKFYFSNRENVLNDLYNFAKAAGLQHPNQLTTKIMNDLQIKLTGGVFDISGAQYLKAAGHALEITKTPEDPRSPKNDILKALKKIGGFIMLVKKYFENSEYVYKDLQAYTKAAGLSHVKDLTTENMAQVTAICCNGEKVRGERYLRLAAVALELVERTVHATKFRAKTLEKLKAIAL